jgi:hypothetical protein
MAGRKRLFQRCETGRRMLATVALTLLLTGILAFVGCGGGSSNRTTNPSTITMMVTGTSGAISHSTPLTLTIQ